MRKSTPALRLRMRSFVIIPARLASTRLPEKLLLKETGKSVLEHTWEAARRARRPLGVRIATDDARIMQEVEAFGGRAVLTSPDHASGTDRVAEVARDMNGADIIVNLQGDEPDIDPESIDQVIELLEANPAAGMATIAAPIRDEAKIDDPACVKVVFDDEGRALYFSRSPIPHVRDRDGSWLTAASPTPTHFQHIGLYAYRRRFLLELAGMAPSPLEKLEKLEQLRALQAGETILVGQVDEAAAGIDTVADYWEFVARRAA